MAEKKRGRPDRTPTQAQAESTLRDLADELAQQGHTPVERFGEAMAEARELGASSPTDPWER